MKKLITSLFALVFIALSMQAQVAWNQIHSSQTEIPRSDTSYFAMSCRAGSYQALCQRFNDSISLASAPAVTLYSPGDSLVWRVIKGVSVGTNPRVRFINTKTGQYLYVGTKGGTTKRPYMGPRVDPYNGSKDFFLYDKGIRSGAPAEYYYALCDAEDGSTVLGSPTAGNFAVGSTTTQTANGVYMWRFTKRIGPKPKAELLASPTLSLSTSTAVLSSGGSITLDAKVTKGATELLGKTLLYHGTTLIDTLTLDANGQASRVYSGLLYGTEKFALVYRGDVNYEPTDSILTVNVGPNVNAKAVTIGITPAKYSAELYNDIDVNFAIKDVNGDPVPAGTVNVYVNGNIKNTFTPDALGTGVVKFQNLLVGTSTISAYYIGDKNIYLDGDTVRTSVEITPSTSSIKPYPVYMDLGSLPEFAKYIDKYTNANTTRPFTVGFASDSLSSISLSTDATTKAYKVSYIADALSYAGTDYKNLFAGPNEVQIPFGISPRPTSFTLKTPWLNKGAYNIYISQRLNLSAGIYSTVTLDDKKLYYPDAELIAPSFRLTATSNAKRWLSKGNSGNLPMTYFGTANIETTNVHSLKFEVKSGIDYAWLDMIEFIPVDQDSLRVSEKSSVGLAKVYYPLFDLGGYARQAGDAGLTAITSLAEAALPYQVTDPTIYSTTSHTIDSLKIADSNVYNGVDYVTVYRSDKWTRMSEGAVDESNILNAKYTCDLPDGNYYYKEFNYVENSLVTGSYGTRLLLKEGYFTVGAPNALNNTKTSTIRAFAVGNTLTVKGIKAGAKIIVTDILGKTILNTVSTSDVYTKALKPAIYLVRVVSANDAITSKVIVK